MRMKEINKCKVAVSKNGVLNVISPKGDAISVMPRGTHVALDVLGTSTKSKVIEYWKSNPYWK